MLLRICAQTKNTAALIHLRFTTYQRSIFIFDRTCRRLPQTALCKVQSPHCRPDKPPKATLQCPRPAATASQPPSAQMHAALPTCDCGRAAFCMAPHSVDTASLND
eukprot:78691-Prymnesium_polylepis.1